MSERPSLREAARDVLEADDALSKLLKGRPISEAEFFASQEREERMEALRAALSAPSPEPGERGDLEELERLNGDAADAPWSIAKDFEEEPAPGLQIQGGGWDVCVVSGPPGSSARESEFESKFRAANAALIVAMRNALPALLAELRAHRAREEGR